MTITIKLLDTETDQWDSYVKRHPQGTMYHLSGWEKVIRKTYGHNTYFLMALKSSLTKDFREKTDSAEQISTTNSESLNCTGNFNSQHNPDKLKTQNLEIVGVLPLIHIKHLLFGNDLISMPYFDYGGILADDEETERALKDEAVALAFSIGANDIELRNIKPLLNIADENSTCTETNETCGIKVITRIYKVRMLRKLPDNSKELMKSFKSKLRCQIRKPIKEGLTCKIGGHELLNDFYRVFTFNMRDLCSPVHSKQLMKNVLETYTKRSKVIIIYLNDQPVACSIVLGFGDTLENPWASSLRKYCKFAPNMLLYWKMLEYACDNGFRYFDFGRSTPEEGTFKFKQQWGAEPVPLHWHYIKIGNKSCGIPISHKKTFTTVASVWGKLPVTVTKFIGPRIRKYISL